MKRRTAIPALVGLITFAVVFAIARWIWRDHPATSTTIALTYGLLMGAMNAAVIFAIQAALRKDVG